MVDRVFGGMGRIFALFALLVGGTAIAISAGDVAALAQPAPGALTDAQDVNGQPGVVMEVTQCKRDGGTLSLRLRVRNTGSSEVKWDFTENHHYIDQFYLLAASKKYLVLRDTDQVPLATPGNHGGGWDLSIDIPANGSYVWYAKYPAPPADVKKISVYTPYTPPFEDVPIAD